MLLYCIFLGADNFEERAGDRGGGLRFRDRDVGSRSGRVPRNTHT